MKPDVVALQRRDRVALASVVSETRAADGTGMFVVLAEDGARFPFPAAQALARVGGVSPPVPGENVPQWLARLRREVGRPLDWKAIHAQVAEGAKVDAAGVAVLAAFDGDAGVLAAALASADAAPWFRREGPDLVAVPRAQAEGRLARVEAEHRIHEQDEALRAWWPRRTEAPVSEACRGALDAIAEFALRGPVPETERGRLLAAKLDIPEPDQALEALVEARALPGDTDPSPQRAGLAGGFGAKASGEAERIAAAPVDPAGREDLTHLVAVAVDDAETTEVDDAISIRPAEGGVEVLVHISDVAAAIPPGSALDKAAGDRVSSLYLPDRSIAMLPPALVPRLSLEAGVVREAVTGVFRIGEDGRLASSRFVRSLVRITRRLTYEASSDPATLAVTEAEGRRLIEVAERLRTARRDAGAILVNLESLKVAVTGGVPHLCVRHQATPGDVVVGELMVLYNREAARLVARADAPAFFRVQAAPREPEPRADDPLYPVRVRRRFGPTAVSIEPGRHHGVGADEYLQATSPLRRFADLVNQRQLAAIAAGGKPPHRHADLERLVGHVVERERAVRTASDDRTAYWIARSLEARRGGALAGVLSRAPRRGMGSVWVPELCRALPLRPPAGWDVPAEGTAGSWRIARVAPWRGRVELEPAP